MYVNSGGRHHCTNKPLRIWLASTSTKLALSTVLIAVRNISCFSTRSVVGCWASNGGIAHETRCHLPAGVSTIEQTTANQERELREIAGRVGYEIVKVYKDHGVSGAKGRDKRPAFDAMCRDATKRQFDVVMAWSVDRLGRSLQDLVAFLSELHSLRIDLLPAPAGDRHHDAGRQGHVSDDGRVCRVRARRSFRSASALAWRGPGAKGYASAVHLSPPSWKPRSRLRWQSLTVLACA